MRRHRLVLAAAFLAAAAVAPAPTRAGRPLLIKLGTLAPDGSEWHLELQQMGQDWRKISAGKVKLRIYPGGVKGDETTMVRNMRAGTLHAAALTVAGLALLTPDVQALSIPMAYRDDAELEYVRHRLGPELEQRFAARGWVILNWADAGWVRFFSRVPATTPDDVRRLRMFTWTGDQTTADLWKDHGFKPVPLAATDMLSSLQTGLIDVTQTTAAAALATQTFVAAEHMIDVRWAPLVGATVIANARWRKVPADLRPELLATARATGDSLRRYIHRFEAEAVESMRKRGLVVHEIDPRTEAAWREVAEKAYPRIRGGIIPVELFDRALALRDEYRRRAQASGEGP